MQSHYTLSPSLALTWLLLMLYSLLLLTLVCLPWSVWLRVGGGALAFAAFAYVIARYARLRLGRSVLAFRMERDNGITLIHRNGLHATGLISEYSLVTPLLVLLHVSHEGAGMRSVVVMRDSMNVESFRRLRVQLRWA